MARLKYIIKKMGISFGANILSILLSSLLTFVIPKYFGVSQYGYWQLYLFYVSYAGLFHLGIQDGVFLRYGGQHYKNLNKDQFHSQFRVFSALEIGFASIIFIIAARLTSNSAELFVWGGFVLCLVVYLPNTFFQYLMQAVGRVKEYAIALIIEKMTLFVLVVFLLIAGVESFQYLIATDIFAKFLSLIYILFQNRPIVFAKWLGIKLALEETKANLSVGFFLLVANLADSLILGFTRFGIETFWDIEIFAHVSLILNLCSFVLIFITATAQIVYPELKRVASEKLSFYYQFFDKAALVILFFIPLLYNPAKIILSAWLPEYIDSFRYMIFTIPLCIFQSKSILLLSTFYKVMRKERNLLFVNLISLCIAIITTSFSVFYFHNIEITIAVATVSIAVRCLLQERYLKKLLDIQIGYSIFCEVTLGFGFMILSFWMENIAFPIYLILYLIFAMIQLNTIKRMWKMK